MNVVRPSPPIRVTPALFPCYHARPFTTTTAEPLVLAPHPAPQVALSLLGWIPLSPCCSPTLASWFMITLSQRLWGQRTLLHGRPRPPLKVQSRPQSREPTHCHQTPRAVQAPRAPTTPNRAPGRAAKHPNKENPATPRHSGHGPFVAEQSIPTRTPTTKRIPHPSTAVVHPLHYANQPRVPIHRFVQTAARPLRGSLRPTFRACGCLHRSLHAHYVYRVGLSVCAITVVGRQTAKGQQWAAAGNWPFSASFAGQDIDR